MLIGVIMEQDMSKSEFEGIILFQLSKHPDWHQTAIDAVVRGMEAYINHLNKINSETNRAFLSALVLCKEGRVSKDVINNCNQVIIDSINKRKNLCKLEEDFVNANGEGK